MLSSRLAHPVFRVGLTRSCLQTHLQPPPFPRRFISRVSSVWKQNTREIPWKRAYAGRVLGAGVVASIRLGISGTSSSKIFCEPLPPNVVPSQEKTPRGPDLAPDYPPPPQSSVSAFELTFGAVTGICAGVFVKKGAKAVAFLLGGVFVMLQYMVSKSFVKVDWGRMSTRFENLFYTRDAAGNNKPPTVVSLWRWLINFLTADFQPRASFLAGFALGLRIG